MSTKTTLSKIVAIVAIVLGAVFIAGGAVAFATVSTTLAAERITVSDDASCAAGATVDGPLAAYCEADIISHHALEATGGKTYAELDREDPLRAVAMNGSFLRASLFTSVVAFGVSAMAMGVGLLFALLGLAVLNLSKAVEAAKPEPISAA